MMLIVLKISMCYERIKIDPRGYIASTTLDLNRLKSKLVILKE